MNISKTSDDGSGDRFLFSAIAVLLVLTVLSTLGYAYTQATRTSEYSQNIIIQDANGSYMQ